MPTKQTAAVMSEHKIYSGTLEEINEKLAADGYTANEQGDIVSPVATPEPAVQGEAGTPASPAAAETPAKVEPETPPTAEAQAAGQSFDRLSFLKQELGHDFNSEDDFNSWKSTITEQSTKYADLQKQYEEAQSQLKSYDIRKHFASDEDFIINQLKIKYPDMNPKVLSNVLTSDIATLNPIDAIASAYLLNDKDGKIFKSPEQAYNYVCKKLDIDRDTPLDEHDEDVQVAVRMEAKQAIEKFSQLKSEITVPASVDLAAQKAEADRQAKEHYDKLQPLVQRDMESVLTGLDELAITEDTKDGKNTVFSYKLGDYKSSKHVQETLAKVVDTIARNAQEWTPQLAKEVVAKTVEQLQNDYFVQNRTAIIKAVKDQVRKEVMDEEFAKGNNNRPLNPDKTNPSMTQESAKLIKEKEQMRKNLGLTGRQFYSS